MRDAVGIKYSQEVSELARRESQVKAGSPAYLGSYPHAVTSVLQSLTEQQREELEGLAHTWKREGPPESQKKK